MRTSDDDSSPSTARALFHSASDATDEPASAPSSADVAVVASARVAAWGYNLDGEVGFELREGASGDDPVASGLEVHVPTLLPRSGMLEQLGDAAHRVVQVSCGSRHTMACTAGGAALTWGWGLLGQLGHGAVGEDASCQAPRVVQALLDARVCVAEVAAGGVHSAARAAGDGGGHVFAWGMAGYGQLGCGRAAVAAGVAASPVRVERREGDAEGPDGDGDGRGDEERDGFVDDDTDDDDDADDDDDDDDDSDLDDDSNRARAERAARRAASLIAERQRLVPLTALSIACGGMHAAAIVRRGAGASELYAWGRADSGQLGIGHRWTAEMMQKGKLGVPRPRRVRRFDGAPLAVACGAFHTALVTDVSDAEPRDGAAPPATARAAPAATAVWTWGDESDGVLGHATHALEGDFFSGQYEPLRCRQLDGARARAVACGAHHTVVVCAGGAVHACGKGEYGRLGLGDARSRREFAALPTEHFLAPGERVVAAAAGGAHTLLLAAPHGRVYACGRGDFGRLGLARGDCASVATPRLVRALARALPPPRSTATERGAAWGEPAADDDADEPTRLVAHPVRQIAAGGSHCALVL